MRVLSGVLRLMLETLREIFDESSYNRFLQRRGLSSSRDSYQQFWREREAAHARRQRCC
jgi:hypothetical protein